MSESQLTATVENLGVQTLKRLARIDLRGQRVLSLYVDLDPLRFPTPDTIATELGALLDRVRADAGERDADRVLTWLANNPDARQGVHGLAIFSDVDGGMLEVVRVGKAIEPLAVYDTVPWLEPLAAVLSPGDWGVAIVDRRYARLLRGGPEGLSEFAAFEDELHGRHRQGGWSQANLQRGIEEQVSVHARRVAARIFRAHRRRAFEQLVIVAADELQPVLEHSLRTELRELLVRVAPADLGHGSEQEVLAIVTAAVERSRVERERELIAKLEQALGTGGPAAAGLDEVLTTLEQRRVKTLLVPERSELRAWRCPTCGRLTNGAADHCSLDGAILTRVDAIEHAVADASEGSARVVVSHDQPRWLHEHGDIAALLLW